MNPIRVMTVFGTRPEAIKLAPVIQQLEKDPQFQSIVAVTAQHREMLDQVQPAIRSSPLIWRDQVSECDGGGPNCNTARNAKAGPIAPLRDVRLILGFAAIVAFQ